MSKSRAKAKEVEVVEEAPQVQAQEEAADEEVGGPMPLSKLEVRTKTRII
jgi:hypothetical protein